MILLLVVPIWMLALLLVVGLCAVARAGDRAQESEAQAALASRARLIEAREVERAHAVPMAHRRAGKRESTSIAA